MRHAKALVHPMQSRVTILSCWRYICCQALFEIYARMQCVRKVISRVARSTTAVRDGCGCAAPCSEISYDVSYSLSRWPAESFDGDEAYTDIFLARLNSLLFFLSISLCRNMDEQLNPFFLRPLVGSRARKLA